MTRRQYKNKITDFRANFGITLFSPSKNYYEFFSVGEYYKIGHYHEIHNTNFDESQLNTPFVSLIKYFNYLIYVFYNDNHAFERQISILEKFLENIEKNDESRHHIKIKKHIYIKNDYDFNGMKKGWIGGLPHLKLICLLRIITKKVEFEKFKKLEQQLFESLFVKLYEKRLKCYHFVNPICSYTRESSYSIHEYPEKTEGPNLVINCELLFMALLNKSSEENYNSQSMLYKKILDIKIEHYDKQKIKYIKKYSQDEFNPITPAYYQLQRSIVHGSGLITKSSKFLQQFECKQSYFSIVIHLIAKIIFRAITGYK